MNMRRNRIPGAGFLVRTVMAAAVGVEIDAWDRESTTSIQVGPGRARIERFTLVHRFQRVDLDEASLRKGVKVLAEFPGMGPVAGTLVDDSGSDVGVAFQVGMSSELPPGRLIEDSRWIQRALQRTLLSNLSGSRDGLALGLFGLPVRASAPQPSSVGAPPDLNLEQRGVVERAVGGGLTIVAAGPGTGKTRTISGVVEVLLAQEGRTLVVAPSNQAADRAALAICTRTAHHRAFGDGLVVRLGHPRSRRFVAQYGSKTDPFRIALRRLGGASADPSPAWIQSEMDAVVRCARVVVTTTVQPLLARVMDRQRFDAVILDEAGMTSLPAAYCAASLADRMVLLVGDPLQLPTVLRSHHPVARTFFGSSAFSASGTPASVPPFESLGVGPWVSLSTQYRMDPPIQELLNHLTYEGRLRVADSVLDRAPLQGPAGGAPLILMDTTSLGPRKAGRRGYANPAHARFAGRVVRWLETGTGDPSHTIAVLARFREQVAALSREIPEGSGVQVRTVHRMQGGEVDTVVLDFSAAPGSFLGDYLTDTTRESDGGRLLTVALSRARRRIVLLANLHLLRNHPGIPADAVARRLLEYVLTYGVRLAPEQLGEPS